MTVIETIVRGVQSLPLREQVEVARYVHRLSASVQGEVPAFFRKTRALATPADMRHSSGQASVRSYAPPGE